MSKILNIGSQVKFSELHNGKMTVIKILGRDRFGNQKYRVRYKNGGETVILYKK